MADISIGVDLGGTNLRAAVVDEQGSILDKLSGDVRAGRDAVVDDIVSSIQVLRGRFRDHRLVGVGIGMPGFIDMDRGLIIDLPNLPGFENFEARAAIEKRLGTTVILENDANAAALGEKWIGAGRNVDDLVMVTLGTGVGGGIIHRGRVMHGQIGMAAEIGHLTVSPYGNPCPCGNTGCLEKHASASAVVAMARLMSLGDETITSRQVYEMAEAGDERAKQVFVHMGRALGVGLAMLIQVFNFPLYLLGGGALPAWNQFSPAMFAEVERRSFNYRNSPTKIEKAELGAEAGLYGAAYLPFLQAKELKS